MLRYEIKEATLDGAIEVIEYASQLKAASSKLVGKHAERKTNNASYLDCSNIETDRDLVLVLNQDINVEGKFVSDLITNMDQDDLVKYKYEEAVYQNIYAGLMARLLSVRYFFDDDWSSRKLVHSNDVECISFVKMYVHNQELYMIAFIRSSSNRLLNVDFIGLVMVALDIIDIWESANNEDPIADKKNFITTLHLSMQITDYHHIKEDKNVDRRSKKKS